MSCLQYKNIIVDKNQSIPYFPPHCGIQCSIPSKVCPLRKRLPLSCHKNSSQIFDATKLWKHTISLTYNTETLISNISETHRFSPQMRLIAYPDHKTTLLCFSLHLWLDSQMTSSLLHCWSPSVTTRETGSQSNYVIGLFLVIGQFNDLLSCQRGVDIIDFIFVKFIVNLSVSLQK